MNAQKKPAGRVAPKGWVKGVSSSPGGPEEGLIPPPVGQPKGHWRRGRLARIEASTPNRVSALLRMSCLSKKKNFLLFSFTFVSHFGMFSESWLVLVILAGVLAVLLGTLVVLICVPALMRHCAFGSRLVGVRLEQRLEPPSDSDPVSVPVCGTVRERVRRQNASDDLLAIL